MAYLFLVLSVVFSVAAYQADNVKNNLKLTGTVRDNFGTFIPHLTVHLDQAKGTEQRDTLSEVDAEGRYSFDHLEEGDYEVETVRFNQRVTRSVRLRNRKGESNTRVVDIVVPAASKISGVIRAEDGGVIPGMTVFLLARSFSTGINHCAMLGSAVSGADGTFNFREVGPNREYLLLSVASFGSAHTRDSIAATFYPSASSADQATPISPQAGESMWLPIQVRKERKACVSTSVPYTKLKARLVRDDLASGPAGFQTAVAGESDVTGNVKICDVGAGSYHLVLYESGRAEGNEFYSELPVTVDSSDIRLSAAADQGPPVTVRGRIEYEEGSTHNQFENGSAQVRLRPINGMTIEGINSTPEVKAMIGEPFEIPSVRPGMYALTVGLPDDTYIKDISYDGNDVIGKALLITAGGQLSVSLKGSAAILTGTVVDEKDVPQVNANVLILPVSIKNLSALPEQLVVLETDPNGDFKSHGIPPGDYYVLATDHKPELFLDNFPRVAFELSRSGIKVTLSANGHSTVKLVLKGS